jgi:hypothetical protein
VRRVAFLASFVVALLAASYFSYGQVTTPFETYFYGSSSPSQPYASTLCIPAVPSASASSRQCIAGNTLYQVYTQLVSGTGNTLSAPQEVMICTADCTVTPPVPPAAGGYEFCIYNQPGTSGVITIGGNTGVFYGKSDSSGYGSSGGTLTSGGSVVDLVCLHAEDATHYDVTTYKGVWTAS